MTSQVPEEQPMTFIWQTSPMGRLALQHELDAAVAFFASPASSYVTVATLALDGGTSGH